MSSESRPQGFVRGWPRYATLTVALFPFKARDGQHVRSRAGAQTVGRHEAAAGPSPP
jgi:hypothetical protein